MAEVNYLTKNGVKRIIESGLESFKDNDFIFQVLSIKNFDIEGKKKKIKQRIILSDGIATMSALINVTVYEGIKDLDLKEHSVICIKNFTIRKVKQKIIIFNQPFKVLGHCKKLGDPKSYEKLAPSDFTKSLNL